MALHQLRALKSLSLLILLLLSIFLAGCSEGRYDKMPAADVAAMSNGDLCFAHRVSQIGFVPLEVARRRIDCTKHDREVIEKFFIEVKTPWTWTWLKVENFSDLLSSGCGALGVSISHRSDTEESEVGKIGSISLGTVTSVSVPYYMIHIDNNSTKTIYYLWMIDEIGGPLVPEIIVGKILPRSQSTARVPSRTVEPTRGHLVGCRAF